MRSGIVARPWVWALLLVVAGAAVYANSLDGRLIYDDDAAIAHNEGIRRLWPPFPAMFPPQANPTAGRPVVGLTLAINYALGGLDVRGYHLLNLAVHLGCALALFGVVRRTLGCPRLEGAFGSAATPLAFACSLIWMVHPLTSECVNYVTQRSESIMALCYLLTLYCAIRAADAPRRGWRASWAAAAVTFCAAGMGAKEVMVTAPLMVLLHDVAYGERPLGNLLRRRIGLYAGLAATWGILAALMAGGPRSATVGFGHGVSAWTWALHQCGMIARYLGLAVWPSGLVLDYGFPGPISLAEAAPAAALVGVLAAAAIALFIRAPAAGYPAVWLFAILAPTSSIVPIVTEVGAERRMYLPLAGLAALAVVSSCELLRRALRGADEARRAAVLAALLCAVTAGLGAATWRRNAAYRDPVGIWLDAAGHVAGNHRARTNLAIAIAATGDLEGAIPWFREALVLEPESAQAHYNLGNALAALGRAPEAVEHYRAAAAADPGAFEARYNLAVTLARLSRLDEAVEQFRLAVDMREGDAAAHYNLGKALAATGRPAEAQHHLRAAIELDPLWPAPRRDAARLLAAGAVSSAP